MEQTQTPNKVVGDSKKPRQSRTAVTPLEKPPERKLHERTLQMAKMKPEMGSRDFCTDKKETKGGNSASKAFPFQLFSSIMVSILPSTSTHIQVSVKGRSH